jgi:hypothetical protein
MYIVVFRNLTDECKGVITWSTFKSKEDFDNRYDAEMRGLYEVVEQGVTQERAQELCSSPEADSAVMRHGVRLIGEALRRF